MMKLEAINTEAQYEAALARIDRLLNAKPSTPEGDEFDALVTIIKAYEEKDNGQGGRLR